MVLFLVCFFFFFKQKTAYEIGTGDWSSDVCSSDLAGMRADIYPGLDEFSKGWARDQRFDPVMNDATRERRYTAWKRAVAAVQTV